MVWTTNYIAVHGASIIANVIREGIGYLGITPHSLFRCLISCSNLTRYECTGLYDMTWPAKLSPRADKYRKSGRGGSSRESIIAMSSMSSKRRSIIAVDPRNLCPASFVSASWLKTFPDMWLPASVAASLRRQDLLVQKPTRLRSAPQRSLAHCASST